MSLRDMKNITTGDLSISSKIINKMAKDKINNIFTLLFAFIAE